MSGDVDIGDACVSVLDVDLMKRILAYYYYNTNIKERVDDGDGGGKWSPPNSPFRLSINSLTKKGQNE